MNCVHPLVGVAMNDIHASLLVVVIGHSVPSHSMMLLRQLLFGLRLNLLHFLGCYTIAICVNLLYIAAASCVQLIYTLISPYELYLDCLIFLSSEHGIMP